MVATKSDRNARRAQMWKMVQDYKVRMGCRECGYNKHPKALQLDHLHSKVANVSDMIRSDYGLETIMKEIAKCQVLCANCHAIVTHERQRTG